MDNEQIHNCLNQARQFLKGGLAVIIANDDDGNPIVLGLNNDCALAAQIPFPSPNNPTANLRQLIALRDDAHDDDDDEPSR
ncbi:MAG: hypothetical protein K0U84_14090 [Actinomycetia bacterium]|nr:hypothetical protein [Actinomycetes bacterium]